MRKHISWRATPEIHGAIDCPYPPGHTLQNMSAKTRKKNFTYIYMYSAENLVLLSYSQGKLFKFVCKVHITISYTSCEVQLLQSW